MASHVVNYRKWVQETYVDQTVAGTLQKWVDDHPEATTVDAIASGLESVLKTWQPQTLRKLSWHFTGDAFDIAPVTGPDGDAMKKVIRALPNLNKFLENESGDVVWHAQFS